MIDNCVLVTSKILTLLSVRCTKQFIADSVLSHVDHPSLLSISDTLEKYEIEHLAIKTSIEKLEKLPLPCIVQTSDGNGLVFSILKSVSKTSIAYYDHEGKPKEITKEDFEKSWTGVCLLVEKNENSLEPNYKENTRLGKLVRILLALTGVLLLSWMFLILRSSEVAIDTFDLSFTLLYTILKLMGIAVGATLLWFEVDQYNPSLQALCSGGKKVDCSAVLNSKYATIFNGQISLGLLGFSYFFASFGVLLVSQFSFSSLALVSYLSFLSLPVILVSLYYQAVIIKQWCKFCLILLAILTTEVLTALGSSSYKGQINLPDALLIILLFVLPIVGWKLIRPLLDKKKEVNNFKRGLQKIKNNPDVLQGLLLKSRLIGTPTEGLGITITNTTAKYDVIKVCNPYCDPCAKAHPILEKLVEQGKINLQIVFTASLDDDRGSMPVKHFLAIDETNNKRETRQALYHWYGAEKKEYDRFATLYPMNGELTNQDKKIEAMNRWCAAEKITYTPTIFINGSELPKEYSVADLTEVLI